MIAFAPLAIIAGVAILFAAMAWYVERQEQRRRERRPRLELQPPPIGHVRLGIDERRRERGPLG